MERIKNELSDALKTAEDEIDNIGSEIDRFLGVMDNFQRNISEKLESESRKFEDLVGDYQGKYRRKNLEYRTVSAYKNPAWLDECTFSVANGEVRRRMEERFQKVYNEYTNDSSTMSEKYRVYLEKRSKEKRGLEAAHGTLKRKKKCNNE